MSHAAEACTRNLYHKLASDEFCTLELLHPTSHHLKVCSLTLLVHTALAQLCSGHCRLLNTYKARITSGISDVCHSTLRRTSVQLSQPSDTTHSMGQPGRGYRLPQPGQLMIRDELLGYHNNNTQNCAV